MWKVYFLRSRRKKWYYVGSTDNLERRIREHNTKKVTSTKAHVPLDVVHTIDFASESEARSFERKIKKQRLLKEQIIRTIEKHWGIV